MPWCVRKCPYCDFNSHPLRSAAPPRGTSMRLIHDLEAELPLARGRRDRERCSSAAAHRVCSRPDDFARFIEALRRALRVRGAMPKLPSRPIPEPSSGAALPAIAMRASIACRSARKASAPRALERLGRIHTPQDTHRAPSRSCTRRGSTISTWISCMRLPEQTLEEAIDDVRTACSLEPAHISHYQLTLEPGTVFHARPPPLPDEDAAWAMQRECQAATRRSTAIGNTRFPPMRSPARAAGTISTIGASATTWAWARAPTANSA